MLLEPEWCLNMRAVQLLQCILESRGEYNVALQGGRVYAERLIPAPVACERRIRHARPHTVIVTGASKGLGRQYVKQVGLHFLMTSAAR